MCLKKHFYQKVDRSPAQVKTTPFRALAANHLLNRKLAVLLLTLDDGTVEPQTVFLARLAGINAHEEQL